VRRQPDWSRLRQHRAPPLIEYPRAAAVQARAILRIAHAQMPDARIKFFEVVTARSDFVHSHTPDARIMLIPKAGL
jgi:hypothetical protein